MLSKVTMHQVLKFSMRADPLGDGISRIDLIDHMGDDLSVVNDAKSSFSNFAEALTEKEVKLLRKLACHKPPHSSPFRGVVFKFKVKAPLFVCRQWWKHIVASNHVDDQYQWNETSLRYVEVTDNNEFYIPKAFRLQSSNNRQASDGELDFEANQEAIAITTKLVEDSYSAYSKLIDLGAARELARIILVPSIYTTWTWTVSLQAVLHFIKLRHLAEGPQHEISNYAGCIHEMVQKIVPEAIAIFEEIGADF